MTTDRQALIVALHQACGNRAGVALPPPVPVPSPLVPDVPALQRVWDLARQELELVLDIHLSQVTNIYAFHLDVLRETILQQWADLTEPAVFRQCCRLVEKMADNFGATLWGYQMLKIAVLQRGAPQLGEQIADLQQRYASQTGWKENDRAPLRDYRPVEPAGSSVPPRPAPASADGGVWSDDTGTDAPEAAAAAAPGGATRTGAGTARD